MTNYRPLTEAGFFLAISLFLLVNQGFVAVQVIYLLIAVLFTGVSYLLPKKPSWFFKLFCCCYVPFGQRLPSFCPQ